MGGGPSRSGYPARANPKNIQPALFSSLQDLMRWEEKLPGIRQLLTAQALTTQLSSTLKPSRDEDPMSIRRALQAPNAKSSAALVHTATEMAEMEEQTQEQSSWIPGPVIPSSSLFAEVAIAEVKRTSQLLKSIPPIEQVRQQPPALQNMTREIEEKQEETSGTFTSMVAPGMPVEQAARVLGLTRRDIEIRREIEKEMSELADTPEMKERTALICKYFYIHCLMQKMVKSSEHCYKIQEKLNFTSSRLRDPRLRPLERVNAEKRLHTAQTLLQDALGNHDNAICALSWLRRDFELCSSLYDVNADIAAARLEHHDVTMLMERRQRILVDLNINERDSLNIGMLYLDKNFDGVLDAEEVPMLSARLFALLDRDRHHAITRENVQRAAMEANDRLVAMETHLSQLQRDVDVLETRATTNEEAAATVQRIKDQQQQLEEKHTTLLATVRAIYRYFHRAFTLHLFSTLDDQHVKVGTIGASSLFRVMDDVILSSYYDPVKPAAGYFSKEEEQNLLYDTLGPMRGLLPSRVPGASRLEGAMIEHEVSPRTRSRAKEMSRVYPTSETIATREYMPPQQETEQERRIHEERQRQRMMEEIEEKETQRQQQEGMKQQRMEEQEQQYQQQIMEERQRERERYEKEEMIRGQQQQQYEDEMRTRDRMRQQQQQEPKQREMEMEKRTREQQEMTMRRREMERQQRQQEERERERQRQRQEEERQRQRQQELERERQRERERELERERERRPTEEQRQYEIKIREQQRQQEERERERERQRERQRQQEQEQERQRQLELERRRAAEEQERQQEMQRQRRTAEAEQQQQQRQQEMQREREREREREELARRQQLQAQRDREREEAEYRTYQQQQQQQQRLRMEKEQAEKRQQQQMEETKRIQPQIQPIKQVTPQMESKYQRMYGIDEEEQPQPQPQPQPQSQAQAYPTARDKSWLAMERDAVQQRRPSLTAVIGPPTQAQPQQQQQQRGVGMLTETEEDQNAQKRYIPRDVLSPMREETSLKTSEMKESEPESTTSGRDMIRPREEQSQSDPTIRVRVAAY